MKTITKAELAYKISSQLGLSISGCEEIINKILDSIIKLTASGKALHIKNFGSFKVFTKAPRPGRDIAKQKTVLIAEKNVMRFSATRKLRNQINLQE